MSLIKPFNWSLKVVSRLPFFLQRIFLFSRKRGKLGIFNPFGDKETRQCLSAPSLSVQSNYEHFPYYNSAEILFE